MSFLLALLACADEAALPRDAAPAARKVMEEGSAEALGVIAMLNDASTTVTTLDVDAGLNKRAAQGLVSHRDGKDGRAGTKDDNLFDTITEVDDVKYVGDTALSALSAYATANGWVETAPDYYGTVETVSFTVTQVEAVIALVNSAAQTTLDDDVGLDSRAAADLVAKRPFTTIEDVAKAKYVGASALTDLREWVDAHPTTGLSTADAVTTLTTDVAGLWFTSESDYPLVVVQIVGPSTITVTSSNVKTLLASVYVQRAETTLLADRVVEASDLAWAFDRYTVEADWWEDYNREQAPAWTTLRTVFETQLSDVTVWRLGRQDSFGNLVGDIDVVVLGVTADGDLVGFTTVSIET